MYLQFDLAGYDQKVHIHRKQRDPPHHLMKRLKTHRATNHGRDHHPQHWLKGSRNSVHCLLTQFRFCNIPQLVANRILRFNIQNKDCLKIRVEGTLQEGILEQRVRLLEDQMVRPLIKSHLKMGGMKLWRKLLRNTFKGLQVLNNSVHVASVICIPPVHVVLLQRH